MQFCIWKNHISATFASIFPDSSIAKSFKFEQLVDRIRDATCYAVSFDECMNKISQNEQMAFIIRHTRTQNTGTHRISEHRQLKSHGNSLKSHGIILSDFCGNPVSCTTSAPYILARLLVLLKSDGEVLFR